MLVACASLASSVRAEATGPPPGGTAPAVAPGWEPLRFPPPTPGTYELPTLGAAADGSVLDSTGRSRRLFDLLGDKIAVLSFVYTACPDVNACPMASYVLSGLQRRILETPGLRDDVRLITLSFDPEHDRPDAMRTYGRHLQREGCDWVFLTTESQAQLAPILQAYGQSVQRDHDEAGRPLRTFSHILRVFLIDRERRIRNIYTTSFLHTDTLWSDIETLRRADPQRASPAAHTVRAGEWPNPDPVQNPSVPLGLPDIAVPEDNSLSARAVALGRTLFFDRRLSHNDTMSCAMCHVPEQGFASNEMATAVGIEGQTVRRNTPTIYNVAYATSLFHDGRERRLEQQVWGPLLARNEMGNPSIGFVLDKLRALPDYDGAFEAAFGGRGPSMETVGMALASYERTIISANSPFDRWHFGGQHDALSPAATRGFTLFTGAAGCARCHLIAADHALFTDHAMHNTGIGYRQAMAPPAGKRSLRVAPHETLRFDPGVLGSAAEPPPSDLGRYEITLDPNDRWKYKTPTLRNVALTAPYMHDGSVPTLRAVVDYYNGGGVPHELLDARIRPLELTPDDIQDLVAFLEALTGDNVDALVADAAAAR